MYRERYIDRYRYVEGQNLSHSRETPFFLFQALGRKEGQELGSLGKASAGAMAAFFSTFTLCPTELVKCKLQAMKQMVTSGQLPATTQM